MKLDLRKTKIMYSCASVALTLMLLGAISLAPRTGLAATAPPTAGACGPITHSSVVVEPPAVDMWEARVDASGDHELILAVHTNASTGQFCYTYRWQGGGALRRARDPHATR